MEIKIIEMMMGKNQTAKIKAEKQTKQAKIQLV